MNNEKTWTKSELRDFWKKVMAEVELKTSPRYTYETILSGIKLEDIDGKKVIVACPSGTVANTIQSKYLDIVQNAVNKIGKEYFKLEFIVKKNNRPVKEKEENAGPLFTQQKDSYEALREKRKQSGLSPKFTFDNFIMGKNNQLAVAIAHAVAEKPGENYNPVFLYSGVGLGKTHLIQAIGNRVLETLPSLKVIYTTGESFTNELIESIQSGRGRGNYTTNAFRNKFRKADVLLIDDIQFIAGKSGTQEEFFHTFNALNMAQKQIVITSDRPPKDFDDIEERITSRFNSGIISDIQAPDLETRVAILRYKRDTSGDNIPDEVISFISQRVTTNIRELEGAYLRVLSRATSTGVEPTRESASQIIGQTIKEPVKTKHVNMNQILKAVCTYYSVRGTDIKGKRRTKELVLPRQVAMYLMKELTDTPFMSIGEFLGGRDHTTIMHGVDKIEMLRMETTKVRQDLDNVKQILDLE